MENVIRKLILNLSFISLFLFQLQGQSAILKGIITDDYGAVIGANVIVQKLSIGTSSDFDGNYELTGIPPGRQIVQISYTGMVTITQEIDFVASETISRDFKMKDNLTVLDEVVVIGYGTTRKRDLVGNVAKLESKDLNDQVGASFETALQGKTPGVQLIQSSGAAGAGSVIRIRGIKSISAGGDPLIVIDGIPLSQETFILGENGGQNNNPLNSLNPNDIASIEVLKDAASSAIYGSRGANGVILITTKRGESGKPRISYSAKVGQSKPSKVLDLLDAKQWVQIQQEAWENDGGVGRAPLPNDLTYADIENIDTDWLSRVIQTGIKHEHNLSVSQGSERFSTYAGVSYSNAESYLVGNSFERISGRVNLDYRPSEKFKVSLSTSLARGQNFKVHQAWSGGIGWAQSTSLPIFPVYKNEFPTDSDQYEEEGYYGLYSNPVAQNELVDLRVRELKSVNNLNLTFKPNRNLTFNLQGGLEYTNLGDYTFEDAIWTTTENIAKGKLFRIYNYNTYLTTQYELPIKNEDHSLTVLGGIEYQKFEFESTPELLTFGLDDHIFKDSSISSVLKDVDFIKDDKAGNEFASLFFRANYSFRGKWLAQFVVRRDASSRFGINKRFGNFPSFGVGYLMSEEPWFESKVINFLKLKGSFGITGNSNIPRDEQYATYTIPQFDPATGNIEYHVYYNGQSTRYQNKLANPNLKWEVVNTFDAGIEIGLWNDRVTAGAAYYNSLTTDALLRVALQTSTGLENLNFFENIGTIRNYGVEFDFVSRNLIGALNWTTRFNIAVNRNNVLDVGTATPDALDGGFGDIRVLLDNPVGTNYIVRFSRLDPQTGRPIWLDKDGNETSIYNVAEDRVATGNIHPKFTGGFSNSFKWKNFDLSGLFVFSYGGKIYDDAAKRHLGVITPDWNFRPEIFDRWRQPGDDARLPKLTRTMLNWGGNDNPWQNNQTLWLEDASYMRLRNVTIGYDVPVGRTKAIQSARVYVAATNLFVWTNYTGWDPEVARDRTSQQQRNIGGTNVTYLTAPQEKAISVGINVEF